MPEANLAHLFLRPLRQIGARYIVTGSIASIVYGEPRLTHDLDLVIFLGQDQIQQLAAVFPSSEFYCPPADVITFEARREHRGHINIIHIATGFKADLYFAGNDPFHSWAFRNARTLQLFGEEIVVAPPEYVIVRKLEFYREGGSEKHLRDIRTMLRANANGLQETELVGFLAERGLQELWTQVRLS